MTSCSSWHPVASGWFGWMSVTSTSPLKGLFGAPDLVFLIKKGLAAAMLAAPLAAMRWSMPACSRICPPCSQSSLMLPLHAACFAAFLWPHRHTNLVVPYSWWKESGIGKGKGEKKAGRSNLCLGLSSVAASLSEAALFRSSSSCVVDGSCSQQL